MPRLILFLAGLCILRLGLYPVCVALFEDHVGIREVLVLQRYALCAVVAGAMLSTLLAVDHLRKRLSCELSRKAALYVLGMGVFWTAPMILDSGALLGDDWYTGMRATMPLRKALELGQFPGFSFLYGNGSAYALQYPPLAFYIDAVFSLFGGMPLEMAFKASVLLFQGLFVVGCYLLCRYFQFARIHAAIAAIVVSWSQQYWVSAYLHGASASFFAIALLPHALRFFLLVTSRGHAVYGVALGVCMGLMALAQPVAAYFCVVWLLLSLLYLVVRRQLAVDLVWKPFLFGVVIAVLISGPFLLNLIWLKPFNRYAFEVGGGPVEPLSWQRILWWSPRVGLPPGIGRDNSAYLGFGLLLSACLAAWRLRATTRGLILLWIAAGVLLVYGSKWPLISSFPFLHLAKGSYRLWPFLAMGLLGAMAFASEFLSQGRRRWFAVSLTTLALLETAPFPLKTVFRTPLPIEEILERELPREPDQSLMLVLPPGQDVNLFQNIYRWITLSERSDVVYHHHEDIGEVGKNYWRTHDSLARGPGDSTYQSAVEYVKWLRVSHIIMVGQRDIDFSALGVARIVTLLGKPVTIITIDGNRMARGLHEVRIPMGSQPVAPGEGVRLPISYYPFLAASDAKGQLQTSQNQGYLSVCCTAPGQTITVFTAFPAWWKLTMVLSVLTLGSAFVFIAIQSSSRRRAAVLLQSL